MSLLDLILEKQIVVMSIGFALIPLLLAVLLVAGRRLRRVIAAYKQRRAEATLLKAAQQEEQRQRKQQRASARQVVTLEEEVAVPVVPKAKSPVQEVPQEEAQKEEETLSPEMQDILSSVFGDEESSAQYEILLADLGDVEIDDLLVLCNEVAGQLQVEPALIVGGK